MINFKEFSTEQLHNTLVTYAQTLELLNNGMFPGSANKHLDRCITYHVETHKRGVEEFVTRPDAEQYAPDEMKEYKEKNGEGLHGIKGANAI